MDSPYLYHQIADKIHRDILTGVLSPGDRLKTIRQMAAEHGCTIVTIQRAYQELANAGLVTRRSGQGTRVVDRLPPRSESVV